MGLLRILTHAVGWPVTGPAFLSRYSMETVRDTAVRELTDESPVRDELMRLQLRLEEGGVDEEGYLEEEARLMARLREIREWRMRLGMPVRGGAVGFPAPGGGPAAERVRLDVEVDID